MLELDPERDPSAILRPTEWARRRAERLAARARAIRQDARALHAGA